MITTVPRPSVELDAEQLAAVNHRQGPCLVLAGPGSGKTRVIVQRFLALIEDGVSPEQVLVLTYTKKAANEMRERAESWHGNFAAEPPLLNYHSFAQRVVRDWGWLIGISPVFRIADSAQSWMHCEAVVSQLKPTTLWNPLRPYDFIDSILEVIGKAKQELVTPAEYGGWCQRELRDCTDPEQKALLARHREIAEVYNALQQRYMSHAVMDHDDTILYAEKLIREQPAVQRAVRDSINYVMVDEYQDTNYAQARLVETLVSQHNNLLVVADDDQAIYKFRGASLANLDRFSRQYPGHRRITLRRNYRSTPQIVDAAAQLIASASARSRIDKELVAQRGSGPEVELWQAADERSEAQAIAAECRRLLENGATPNSIAWLFRQHKEMRAAISALRQAGVPHFVQGGRGFFVSPIVKDLLAALSAVRDPHDTQALLRCLRFPSWRVSNQGRLSLVEACKGNDESLFTLATQQLIKGLDEGDGQAIQRCTADLLELHGECDRSDVRDLLQQLIESSRYLDALRELSSQHQLYAGAYLNKLAELIDGFCDWSNDHRLDAALQYLEVLRNSRSADEIPTPDALSGGIVLSTTHSAKGLEWPVVIISGCTDNHWKPRRGSAQLSLPDELIPEPPPPGDDDLDEERRLFYVAATRAQDRLILSHALRYTGSYHDEKPTPFLQMLTAENHDVVSKVIAAKLPADPGSPLPAVGNERLRLSVSDVRTFKDCPRRFEYRYRFRMRSVDTVQRWYGTLVHRVLQNAAMRRQAGENVNETQIRQMWQEAWQTSPGPKGKRPELRAYGEDQLRRYIGSPLWQEADIAAVESSFSMNGPRVEIVGRFDRIDNTENGKLVVDYKTSAPRGADKLTSDLQVRAYAAALARQEKQEEVRVQLHYLQTTESVEVVFAGAMLRKAQAHIEMSSTEVVDNWDGNHFPPKPSPWTCPRCEFRTICDEGQAAASQTTS